MGGLKGKKASCRYGVGAKGEPAGGRQGPRGLRSVKKPKGQDWAAEGWQESVCKLAGRPLSASTPPQTQAAGLPLAPPSRPTGRLSPKGPEQDSPGGEVAFAVLPQVSTMAGRQRQGQRRLDGTGRAPGGRRPWRARGKEETSTGRPGRGPAPTQAGRQAGRQGGRVASALGGVRLRRGSAAAGTQAAPTHGGEGEEEEGWISQSRSPRSVGEGARAGRQRKDRRLYSFSHLLRQ